MGSKGESGHRACQPPPESQSQQCERLWAPEGGEKGGWEDEAPSQMNNQMFIYAASHLQEPGHRPQETRPAPWPPSALVLASTAHLDAEVWPQLQRWAAIGRRGGSIRATQTSPRAQGPSRPETEHLFGTFPLSNSHRIVTWNRSLHLC